MRHESLLGQKAEDGATLRAHLEARARKGSQTAMDDLEGPDPPEHMLYLMEWAYALCGRSGASMAGVAPLSHVEIAEWARLMGTRPSALETQALIMLDGVIRDPEETSPEPEQESAEDVAWPEKKRG